MNRFILNIILAFTWMFLNGDLDFLNFVEGFVIGFMILLMSTYAEASRQYFIKFYKAISFIIYFIYELILANLKVAYDVITPRHRMNPAIIAVPLDLKSETGITMLANVITLTPGTLSLDVSSDKRILYVHAAYVNDKSAFIDEIKNGFEKKLLEIFE